MPLGGGGTAALAERWVAAQVTATSAEAKSATRTRAEFDRLNLDRDGAMGPTSQCGGDAIRNKAPSADGRESALSVV
jgi:hypothetical protein